MRSDMAAALAQYGQNGRVGDLMQRDFVTVSPHDMLHSAFLKLQDCNCHTLPVVQNGRLLGLMTADNLAEVLMIQESLRESHRRNYPTGPNAAPTTGAKSFGLAADRK
jgi:CBS-domain-containing membrane protein